MTRTREVQAHVGAYGNKPLDMDQRPPVEPSKPNELCPMVCGIWSTYQQFSLPHDIKFSNDGLAYVADRGNKRVQGVHHPRANSSQSSSSAWTASFPCQARSVAFSPDPAQRFLYVSGSPDIYILNRKTLEVLGSIQHWFAARGPSSHLINVDHEGNVYAVQAELSGADDIAEARAPISLRSRGFRQRFHVPL